MEDFYAAPTRQTPEIDFRYSTHILSISGESFPENAARFYSGLFDQIREYLPGISGASVTINVHLTYFNSASTKLFFKLFSEFNDAAGGGNRVAVNWMFDADDDTMREFGEELAHEFTNLAVIRNAHPS